MTLDADTHVGAVGLFTVEIVNDDDTPRDLTDLVSAAVVFQGPDGARSAAVALTPPADLTTGLMTGTLNGTEFTMAGWHLAQVLETWPTPEGARPTRATRFRVGPNFHATPTGGGDVVAS